MYIYITSSEKQYSDSAESECLPTFTQIVLRENPLSPLMSIELTFPFIYIAHMVHGISFDLRLITHVHVHVEASSSNHASTRTRISTSVCIGTFTCTCTCMYVSSDFLVIKDSTGHVHVH